MSDTSHAEASKVDATPVVEGGKPDAPAETAQAEKTEGDASTESTTVPAAAQATATEEQLDSATAVPTKETPATEASTAAPVATETNTEETKLAEEKKDEPKVEKADESTTKEATVKRTLLDEFDAKLPDIVKDIGHDEMWGVKLVTPVSTHIPSQIVLQKFLNANDGDLAQAVDQFKGALRFRKEKKPVELVKKVFNAKKFADLGAVTVYPVTNSIVPEVFTWNMYGNVKGKMDEVFVPLDEFMDYRIALQELGIQQLNLSGATEPITAETDPYKIIQVHDYKSISFLRQPPSVKAASTEVIKQFALAYPELLKEKYFVNVPAIMGWVYGLIKVFIAEKTAKKFHPMANGANLAAEFQNSRIDGKQLPKEYGGEGGSGDGNMKDIPGLISELKFE